MPTSPTHRTCPYCHSHAIEPLPLAYSKGVRLGRYVTTNGLSQALAPPEPKDELFFPLWVGLCFFGGSYFVYPFFGDGFLPWMHALLEAVNVSRLWFSGLVAGILCLFAMAHRVRWNVYHFNERFRFWQNSFFCRRCGDVHLDPELGIPQDY